MINELKKKMADKMEAAINVLKKEFATIRTGRASLSLLDAIKVDYYGTMTPLNQVATLAVPESRLIIIQPWDPKAIENIEKAITNIQDEGNWSSTATEIASRLMRKLEENINA